jgi:hypothetical protein
MNSHDKALAELTEPPRTAEYESLPQIVSLYNWYSRKPMFGLRYVPWMMMNPRIRFGLWLLKGPILAKSRFFVETEHADVKQFVVDYISRFWQYAATTVFKCLEWGYSGSEVMYRMTPDGIVNFDRIKYLQPRDLKLVTKHGRKAGILVSRVPGVNGLLPIGGPRSLWVTHEREENPWYGSSRLAGAFEPWYELATNLGAKEMRRLYYFKFAFPGDTIYHKGGSTMGENGIPVPNKQLARSMVEQMRSGAAITIPTDPHPQTGIEQWRIERGTASQSSVNILEYIDTLHGEILEGLGVPTEVAAASGTGAYAGRRVPQDAFYSILHNILVSIFQDVDDQSIREVSEFNFGSRGLDYNITPFGLLRTVEDEQADASELGVDPGQALAHQLPRIEEEIADNTIPIETRYRRLAAARTAIGLPLPIAV